MISPDFVGIDLFHALESDCLPKDLKSRFEFSTSSPCPLGFPPAPTQNKSILLTEKGKGLENLDKQSEVSYEARLFLL